MTKWFYIALIFCGLIGCNQYSASKETDLMVVEGNEVVVALSKSEAISGVLEGKLRERLENARLQKKYPAFEILEADTLPFKSEISDKTELQGFKILASQEQGDTLLVALSVTFGDSLQTTTELLRALLVSKIVTIDGEQVLAREIHFKDANTLKKQTKE